MPAGWLQNYFNTNQITNTFKNRNQVVRYDLRIFTRIFSAENGQKNKNIQPRSEKQDPYRKPVYEYSLSIARDAKENREKKVAVRNPGGVTGV